MAIDPRIEELRAQLASSEASMADSELAAEWWAAFAQCNKLAAEINQLAGTKEVL